MRIRASVVLGATIAAMACASSAAAIDATVQWTRYGVPHVTAQDYQSLGYGYGYAVARDRLCLLADRIITLRGERSRWYGPEQPAVVGFLPSTNLNSDLFHRVQLSDESVAAAAKRLDERVRALSRGYAAGFNRYVKELPPQEAQRLCPGAPMPAGE